jgi:hypothetical protein
LIQQLEDNNQQVLIHKLEIRSLKDQVIKLLEERHFNLMGGGQQINVRQDNQQTNSKLMFHAQNTVEALSAEKLPEPMK